MSSSLKRNSVSQKIAGVAWRNLSFTLWHTGQATTVPSMTKAQFWNPGDPVRSPFASVVKYLAVFLCLCSVIIPSNSISIKKKKRSSLSILKCGLHSCTLFPQCRFLLISFSFPRMSTSSLPSKDKSKWIPCSADSFSILHGKESEP